MQPILPWHFYFKKTLLTLKIDRLKFRQFKLQRFVRFKNSQIDCLVCKKKVQLWYVMDLYGVIWSHFDIFGSNSSRFFHIVKVFLLAVPCPKCTCNFFIHLGQLFNITIISKLQFVKLNLNILANLWWQWLYFCRCSLWLWKY